MQQMRDLLRSNLSKSLGSLGTLDRLSVAWSVAAGRAIAERSRVTQMTDGVATVLVHGDSEWLNQLRRMTPQLCGDLSRASGIPVIDILFLAETTAPNLRRRQAIENES